jgi:hypothetical protein
MKKGKGKKKACQGVATSSMMEKGKGKKNAGREVATSSSTGTPKVEELPWPGPTLPEQNVVNQSELADSGNMALVPHDRPTSQQQAAEHLGNPDTEEQLMKMLSPLPAATGGEDYLADEFTEWCQTKQQQLQQQQDPEDGSTWFPMSGEDFLMDLPMLTEADDLFTFTFEELLAGIPDEASPDEQVYSSSNQQHQYVAATSNTNKEQQQPAAPISCGNQQHQ